MDSVKISYIGHSCFKLSHDGHSLVIDPYASGYVPGLEDVGEVADSVFCSHGHEDHGAAGQVEMTGNDPNWDIQEIYTDHDDAHGSLRGGNIVRIFKFRELRIAHLGDLGRPLTEEELRMLSGLDCMMIPVGGFFTIGPEEAAAIVEQTAPRVVIPMHYRSDCFGYDVLSTVTEFTDRMENVTFGGHGMSITADMPRQVRVLWPERAPERIMDRAIDLHHAGFNCAQSVIASLGRYTGLDDAIAFAAGGGFGGGFRSGEICGAISGAVMALGMCFPYNDAGDTDARGRIAALTKECVDQCRSTCGAVTCRELLQREGGKGGCDRFIAHCSEIAEKIINENKEKNKNGNL